MSVFDEIARPRRRSRYPRPGTLANGWWETDTYETVSAQVAVMATSRHRWTLTDEEALDLLRGHYGPGVRLARKGRWRTVTAHDIECGGMGDSDRGDWSEAGTGQAWVLVGYPDEATVFDSSGGES